jgi:hypothetical protein
MCNLYSITTNQAAIAALFRVINRYVGKLAPMPGVFPDYPAGLAQRRDGTLQLPWSPASSLIRWPRHRAWPPV